MSTEKINIVQIQTVLMLGMTAAFIENKLKVAPNPELTVKRAVFWNASDFPVIIDRLEAWLKECRKVDITKVSGDRPKADKTATADDKPKTDKTATATAADPFAADPFSASAPVDPFASSAPSATVVDPFAGV